MKNELESQNNASKIEAENDGIKNEKPIPKVDLTPEQRSENIKKKIEENEIKIAEITALIENTKTKLDEVRESINIPKPETDESPRTLLLKNKLDNLVKEKENLENGLTGDESIVKDKEEGVNDPEEDKKGKEKEDDDSISEATLSKLAESLQQKEALAEQVKSLKESPLVKQNEIKSKELEEKRKVLEIYKKPSGSSGQGGGGGFGGGGGDYVYLNNSFVSVDNSTNYNNLNNEKEGSKNKETDSEKENEANENEEETDNKEKDTDQKEETDKDKEKINLEVESQKILKKLELEMLKLKKDVFMYSPEALTLQANDLDNQMKLTDTEINIWSSGGMTEDKFSINIDKVKKGEDFENKNLFIQFLEIGKEGENFKNQNESYYSTLESMQKEIDAKEKSISDVFSSNESQILGILKSKEDEIKADENDKKEDVNETETVNEEKESENKEENINNEIGSEEKDASDKSVEEAGKNNPQKEAI